MEAYTGEDVSELSDDVGMDVLTNNNGDVVKVVDAVVGHDSYVKLDNKADDRIGVEEEIGLSGLVRDLVYEWRLEDW